MTANVTVFLLLGHITTVASLKKYSPIEIQKIHPYSSAPIAAI
jgi:hypothetical protein